MKRTIAIALCLALTGCIGFRGDRGIKCKVNILGNTVEWESTLKGAYSPTKGAPPPQEQPTT